VCKLLPTPSPVLEKVAEVLAAEDIGVGAWAVGFLWEVAKTCGWEMVCF
jgi:hypothetical protein